MNIFRLFIWVVTFVTLILGYSSVDAFVLPQNASVGPGSEWIYSSNLGTARSEILSRERSGTAWLYDWRLSVAGVSYQETLHLTDDELCVTERTFTALHMYRDNFAFPEYELTLTLPLQVGSSWGRQTKVQHGSSIGITHVTGSVLQKAKIKVAAGEFEAYEIKLDRQDDFGSVQHISLWLDPEVGVIRAEAELRWRGMVGKMQNLVGFDHFQVELQSYKIVPAK